MYGAVYRVVKGSKYMRSDKGTIFLVDDDASIRKSLSRSLKKRGHKVEAFESSRAFLDKYRPEYEGCLVLDLSMPGMTGLDLQKELNKRSWQIPIIFITGHGDTTQSALALNAGAIAFIEKPFTQETLLSYIALAMVKDKKLRKELVR